VTAWLQDLEEEEEEEEILYSDGLLKGATKGKFFVSSFTVTSNGGKKSHINRSKKLCTAMNEIKFPFSSRQ
jgi:hypothetical protein